MEMPKPTDAHRKLARLAGAWEGSETMHPSQWDPKGGTATGRSNGRVILDGFALVIDYQQERDGAVTFAGHGVLTYDSNDKCYVMHWFDSMGSPAEVFRGTFDDNVLTLAHGGPAMHVRLTYDLSGDKRMKNRMEMSMNGEDWKALFDGEYEKK
jgi:uncharacterized protein YodC (DUF2158 family)